MSANTIAPARINVNVFPLSIPVDHSDLHDVRPAGPAQITLLSKELLPELAEFELGRSRSIYRALRQLERAGQLTFGIAHFVIGRTISELRVHRQVRKALTTTPQSAPRIPDGRYALRGEGDVVKFYRLVTSRRGYQNVFVYASDAQHELPLAAHAGIKRKIVEAGVEASGTLFGVESQTCRHCGRKLTDKPAAIAHNGYGPDCFQKYGH